MSWLAEYKERILQLFTPRKMRQFRESLTGYLFVTPALILIFTFGIFPVAFALFVSLHKWRIVRTDFVGLENYVRLSETWLTWLGFSLVSEPWLVCISFLKRSSRLPGKWRSNPGYWRFPGLCMPGRFIISCVISGFSCPNSLILPKNCWESKRPGNYSCNLSEKHFMLQQFIMPGIISRLS